MKKKLLAILLALVLCFGVVALVACDNDKPGPGPSGGTEVPTEAGKVTLYWNVENTVELTEITSYFLCGTPNSWTQGNCDYEFKQLGDTKTFYVMMDPAVAKGAEYKVLIGYNSKSPVDKANQGPFWANEGYGKTWAAGGANSVVPEFTGDKVDCGTIEFDGCLGDPVAVTNFDVKVSFIKGQLTDKSVVYIMGHFSSWANSATDTKIIAVKDTTKENSEDLDVYKIHVDSMYAKENAEYLVVVFPNGLDGITPVDDDGNAMTDTSKATVWNYFNALNSGAIKVGVGKDASNATVKVSDLYTDDYMEIANTISQGSDARGLDLSKKVEDKNDKDEALGHYSLNMNTILPAVDVTLTVSFTTAIPAGAKILLVGEGADGLKWAADTIEMTATDETRKTFSVKIESLPIGTVLQVKVIVFNGNADDLWNKDVNPNYGTDGAFDGQNISVTIEQEGTIKLVEEALVYPHVEEAK